MADEEQGKSLPSQFKGTYISVRNGAVGQGATVYSLGRKVVLASVGAAAMTADEAGGILNKLIERGELAESDVVQLLGDAPTEHGSVEVESPQTLKGLNTKTGAALEERVEAILAKLNVPSKDDIDELSKKIAELNRKISELNE